MEQRGKLETSIHQKGTMSERNVLSLFLSELYKPNDDTIRNVAAQVYKRITGSVTQYCMGRSWRLWLPVSR